MAGEWRRDGALAALAVLALALTGCTADAVGPTASPTVVTAAGPEAGALPDGVTVELQQLRSDVAARQAQVFVMNGTDESLVIGSVEVEDPRFDGPAARVEDRESIIAPGATVGIRVQLPDPACEGGADAASAATVTLAYALDAARGLATAPIDDPLGFVPPLHERDCRAEAVADAAHLKFIDFDPSAPGEPAHLELSIAPTGRGSVLISGIQTTNLITFGDTTGTTVETYPIGMEVLEGGTGQSGILLPIVPLRCDPHAVQEDKRGTIFDVRLELDGDPGEIELFVGEALRGRILTWVADWCGFGTG